MNKRCERDAKREVRAANNSEPHIAGLDSHDNDDNDDNDYIDIYNDKGPVAT